MKMKKISVVVAATVSLMASTNVFATQDNKGDSLVNLPENESTVTSPSVEVWFGLIDKASGYTIDIVGAPEGTPFTGATGLAVTACGNVATPPTDPLYSKSFFVSADDLSCGSETAATKPGDGNEASVHLCTWTTPDLANGTYAIAINPVFQGQRTSTLYGAAERRVGSTCAGNDTPGYANNTATSTLAAGGITNANNSNYNRFIVDAGNGVATAVPTVPIPLLPQGGSVLPGSNELMFIDNSELNNLSTWYELFMWDKNNNRITNSPDNPSFPGWYKHTVDSELDCTTTNALGHRTCTIDITGSLAQTAAGSNGTATVATGDLITWWIRGYNAEGITAWSSAATFKAP